MLGTSLKGSGGAMTKSPLQKNSHSAFALTRFAESLVVLSIYPLNLSLEFFFPSIHFAEKASPLCYTSPARPGLCGVVL